MRTWIAMLCVLALAAPLPVLHAQEGAAKGGEPKAGTPEALIRDGDVLRGTTEKEIAEAHKQQCFRSKYHLLLIITHLRFDIEALDRMSQDTEGTVPAMSTGQKAGLKRSLEKTREAAAAELKRLEETRACFDEAADPKTPPLPKSADLPPESGKGQKEIESSANGLLALSRKLKCIGAPPDGVTLRDVHFELGYMLFILRVVNGLDSKLDWVVEIRRKAMAEIDRLENLGACPEKHAGLAPKNQALLDELNKARTNPQEYAKTLRGPAAAEAIAFLNAQKPLEAVTYDPRLGVAASLHLTDLQTSGQVSHSGSDGSTVMVRVQRQGLYSMTVAEEISTGETDPGAIIRQLIIDATTPTRGHRLDLFNPRFVLVGIACGPHSKSGSLCVIDFSIKPMDR
jgi:uncharacterized protein YkwD